MAMAEIDRKGKAIYRELIDWNREYGTGIQEDVAKVWEEYLRLVADGNENTLATTRNIMRDILDLTLKIANAQGISIYANPSEMEAPAPAGGMGSVGRNPVSGSPSGDIGGVNAYSWANNELQKELAQLQKDLQELDEQLESIPRYDKGGHIDKDQLAILHKGEWVLTAQETKAYEKEPTRKITYTAKDFADIYAEVLQKGIRLSNAKDPLDYILPAHQATNNASYYEANPTVNVGGVVNNFNGITSEGFMRDLRKRENKIKDDVLEEVVKRGKRVVGRPVFTPI
jgi:hypothetical protein